jgi:hypothetical protein
VHHVLRTTSTIATRIAARCLGGSLDRRDRVISPTVLVVVLIAHSFSYQVSAQTNVVDPFAVIAAFDRAADLDLWPGFDATTFPIAIYDGERTLLLRHPSPPEEFQPLQGHEAVWVYAGKHPAMRWNSTADIGGTLTATLLLTIEPGRAADYEAHILFHEVFHLHSRPLHPSWRPNEMWRYSYPMNDLENYRQLLLEEEALARAMQAESHSVAASWAAAAVAIRRDRQAKLSEEHRTYETALELQEGTAVYMGRSTIGTADETLRLLEDRGPEGIRWRCYETGAAISVILDRLAPSWKQTLDAEPETTFADLLGSALTPLNTPVAAFSDEEHTEIAERAKAAIAGLSAERAELYEDFNSRGTRIVIRLADQNERFSFERFDPMAVEVLDRGEALQTHLLTTSHPRGHLRFENPHFVRRSLDGVIALTSPAGQHPFLDGFRQIAISGFSGKPVIERGEAAVKIEAEGLSLSFDGAAVESTGEVVMITVLPGETAE